MGFFASGFDGEEMNEKGKYYSTVSVAVCFLLSISSSTQRQFYCYLISTWYFVVIVEGRSRSHPNKQTTSTTTMKFSFSTVAFGALLSLFQSSSSFQPSLPSANFARRVQTTDSTFSLASSASKVKPGSAELDTPWEELGFEFRPTNSHVKLTYKDGEWGAPELVKVSLFGTTSFFAFSVLSYSNISGLSCLHTPS